MQVSFKFKKVFINLFVALLCFSHLNAHAELITGAFGIKLGEYIPAWTEGQEEAELSDFKDDFFDRVEFLVLPYSKRIYRIEGIKIVQTQCGYGKERNALIDTLREKYGKYEQEIGKDWRAIYKFQAGYKDREVSVSCWAEGDDWLLVVAYRDSELAKLLEKEKKMIEKEKIDASKL